MKRFWVTFQNDLRVQWRSGFYAATLFVTLFWVAILSQLQAFDFTSLLPSMLIGNLAVSTFYFVAALVLLEKDEGSLTALRVTPLRLKEYLLSKVLSLTIPALLETLVLTALIAGWQVNWLLLIGCILLTSTIYVLVGFAVVQRYRGINEFLLPSGLLVGLLWLPLMVRGAGILLPWYTPHPLNPAFWLVNAALVPQPWITTLLAIGVGLLALVICAAWAQRSYSQAGMQGGEK
ncbi:MAG: hypothetical protein U0175_15470 [Caldilineaceae bacterium]